ncbi:hypothetical protein [Streptomyces decoyicus]|uniref:hypothetical protein n=1 Tax=Streptomyces decoyicus TaxID=249567 RepID=UPI00364F9367
MPLIELDLLVEHSDAAGRDVIREAAIAAGLIWKCRHSACPTYNQRSDELCGGCGRSREGRPLSDFQPGLYVAPDELWEELRDEVTDYFRQQGFAPLPDAVTFPRVSNRDAVPWSHIELVLHYGGVKREHLADPAGTEIEDLLEQIALAIEPTHHDLRIALAR